MTTITDLSAEELDALRPRIADGVTVRHYDGGVIAWSPLSARPVPLDGVAAVVFQILDGSATVANLVTDIHEVVGVPEAVARSQLRQALTRFAADALLDGTAQAEPTKRDLFPAPPNP